MSVCDRAMQQVKNNKEDSIALAKHAREKTADLFDGLKMRSDLSILKPTIEHFVEFVTHYLSWLRSCVYRRTLNSIATFTHKRAERSILEQMLKKQSDANNLKKWKKELTMAIDRFDVREFHDLIV
jgi:hypothetical protein